MKTPIIAAFDNIVGVKIGGEEQRTQAGLILPDQKKGVPWKIRILSVGTGRTSEFTGQLIPPVAEVDDVVLVPPFSDYVHPHEGVDYVICSERKILAFEPKADPEPNTQPKTEASS